MKFLWLSLFILVGTIIGYIKSKEDLIIIGLSGGLITFFILFVESFVKELVYRKDFIQNTIKNRKIALSLIDETVIIQDFFDNKYPEIYTKRNSVSNYIKGKLKDVTGEGLVIEYVRNIGIFKDDLFGYINTPLYAKEDKQWIVHVTVPWKNIFFIDTTEESHNPQPKILCQYNRKYFIGERSPFQKEVVGYYEGAYFHEEVNLNQVKRNNKTFYWVSKFLKK